MQASEYTRTSQLDCITIPQAPRLGSQVVEVENLSKSYGDRLLIKDLSFSVPPGSVVGRMHAQKHTCSTCEGMPIQQAWESLFPATWYHNRKGFLVMLPVSYSFHALP